MSSLQKEYNLENEKVMVHYNIFILILNHTKAPTRITLKKGKLNNSDTIMGPSGTFFHQLVNMSLTFPEAVKVKEDKTVTVA